MNGRPWKVIRMIITLCLIWVITVGCSSGGEDAAAKEGGMTAVDSSQTAPAEDDAEDAAEGTSSHVAYDSKTSSSSGASSSANEGASLSLFEAMNRKIIYHANLLIRVEEYAVARRQLDDLIFSSDSYIVSMDEEAYEGHSALEMTVKVPQKGFTGFVQKLEELSPGHVTKSIKGQDVTEEYVDLESRLIAKRVVEERLLGFMKGAAKTEDLLRISKDLSVIQEEIEKVQGRMRYLDNHVAYSTVDIRLVHTVLGHAADEPPSNTGLLREAWNALWGSVKGIYGVFKGAVIVLAALLPVLVVIGLVGLPVYRIYLKKKEKLKLLRQELARENEQLMQSRQNKDV